MQLNFGKGKHCLPHFYYCSVAKWILQFHSDLSSTLRPGSQMIDYNYCFCNNYFCTCFLHWCAVFPWNDLKQNWGCSMAVPIIKTYKNSNYNGLFGYLMEAKTTVELWESEIRAGPFCGDQSAKSTVKSGGRGRGHDLPPLPDFFLSVMHLKEWTLLKWLQLNGLEKSCFLCIIY